MTLKSFVRTGLPAVCASLALTALPVYAQKMSAADKLKQEVAAAIAAANAAKGDATTGTIEAAKAEGERQARIREALAAPTLSPSALMRGTAAPGTPGLPAQGAAAMSATVAIGAEQATPATPDAQAPSAPAGPETVAMGAEQRLALVIGNSGYKTSPLINPVNDARAMAIKLQQLGFTVIKRENASLEEMMSAVREFGNQLKNGGVGLFYYAGHGIQAKGVNYLVPVDANIAREDELATRAYNANEVLEKMDTAKNRINLVVLDACRDNPFARSFRSGARGLAGMDSTPKGTLVAYATSPGSTASDGSGSNGLYTAQLLAAMAEPGVKVEDVFKRVREGVLSESEGKQTPWEMSSITGNFYFNPTAEQQSQPVVSAVAVPRVGAMARNSSQTLIPRKLIENYQLAGNFAIQSGAAQGGFSASGHHFALVTGDKTLHVWNTDTGIATVTEPGYGVSSMSANRRYLLGLADNGKVTITDLHNEAAPKVLTGLPAGITKAGLSPDGRRLVIHTRDDGFMLYDAESGQRMAKLDSVDGEPRFDFAPVGKRLLTWGSRDSAMKLWDSETGSKVARMSDHWDPVALTRFSRDGALLVSAAANDKAVIFRMSDGDSVRRFSFGDGNPVPQFADFFQDGKRVLAYVLRSARQELGAVMHLGVWDSASGNFVASLLGDGITVRNYRFSPDRSRLFVNAGDRNLYVFDMNSLKRLSTLSGAELLHVSPDGRRAIVKGTEGVRLVDVQTLSPLARMPGQVSAYMSSKGGLFVTSTETGLLTLWSLENGDAIGHLKGHLDAITGALFSDDGRRLVTVGTDNVAKLWALPDIREANQLVKDQFESSAEYHKRMSNWSSPYSALAHLVGYNADTQTYSVKVGDVAIDVPFDRDAARKLMGQRQAIVTGNLRFFDVEQLVLADAKLTRLP
ncbi:MAG: caspase family protein [Burkholderiaceae bacterium]|nr:caspase family protein [Burkholderiaceae bacterium]